LSWRIARFSAVASIFAATVARLVADPEYTTLVPPLRTL
jgi:hypothetical protein